MMLKDFWFKQKKKRNENIPAEILKDLDFFLDLNYIPEKADTEATGALYDAAELSAATEPEATVLTPEEAEVLAPEAMPDDFFLEEAESHAPETLPKDLPPEEDFYKSYSKSYSLPSMPAEESGAFTDAPQAPQARSKRRIGMPLPEVGRIGSARPESVQAPKSRQPARGSQPALAPEAPQALQRQSLDDVISALGMTFQQKLLTLIDAKGYSDPQVYRKANLDRKLFSKIRCNADYKPSKLTALALAIALELNLDEATDLLGRAGLALSPSSLTDMIVKYCITNQIYDIYDVNALLYEHDQQLLGL